MPHMNQINEFNLAVKYADIYSTDPKNTHDSHIHHECEIYINISGDVSFIVENRIYPIIPGSIIITRPFEYHHCVYHSNKRHKHFWILFSSSGNEHLLDIFYKRKPGENNLLTLPPEETEKLVALCHSMTEEDIDECNMYYKFFKLINILKNADVAENTTGNYPDDVIFAINYINHHFAEQITVSDIAKGANVSVNTLERHFKQSLHTSPSDYIRKKRLANAAKLLISGCSVAEASENSGFADYSNFIYLFRKTYGTTPFKYKKELKTKI